MKTLFELKNVYYSYGEHEVLRDINLKIYKNEVLIILGPNGAGKTTLLKIIDALILPTKGEVYFKNMKIDERKIYDPNFNKEFRKSVGFVFQNPDIMLFNPTIFDEVLYSLLQIYDKEEAIKIAEETLKKLNIYHLKDKHPYNISGGEKKKVSLACVLALNPEVILMDEPTSFLDPKSRRELVNIIRNLKNDGKTLVIVTHDLSLLHLADRCCIINKELVYDGDVDGIFSLDLEGLNLDIGDLQKLFLTLKKEGFKIDKVPLTVDEGLKILKELIN
ncbi:ABC transporter related protein [Methanocaldococcus infernus ME]|uniref:ABC transporter related protein n=1 Tax=Methanocaldococcus infernus (strain DSM 11812 / JCM 15783 / ME) TaxID=573063 RepID=D5VQX5_METIM|nr:ABC transporter ATP-binding protein [Methanocaldococcus infernus]ADG12978.1 ABC transporter related protein [Methanocaldococcus infernus ME]